MFRKVISLLVVLSLAVMLIACPVGRALAGPKSGGDVDPTGLDSNSSVSTDIQTPTMSTEATETAVMSWISNYMVRFFLRSIGL